MRPSPSHVLLAVCVLALLLGGLGLALLGERSQARGTPAEAPAPRPDPTGLASEMAPPSARGEVVPPARKPTAPMPEPGGIEEGAATSVYPPGTDFRAKYEGLDAAALQEALAQLELELHAERQRLFDERFESGRALPLEGENQLPLDERVRQLAPPEEASSPGLVFELRADPAAEEGELQMLVAFLSRAEYPELHARMHEREWLAVHAAVRRAERP